MNMAENLLLLGPSGCTTAPVSCWSPGGVLESCQESFGLHWNPDELGSDTGEGMPQQAGKKQSIGSMFFYAGCPQKGWPRFRGWVFLLHITWLRIFFTGVPNHLGFSSLQMHWGWQPRSATTNPIIPFDILPRRKGFPFSHMFMHVSRSLGSQAMLQDKVSQECNQPTLKAGKYHLGKKSMRGKRVPRTTRMHVRLKGHSMQLREEHVRTYGAFVVFCCAVVDPLWWQEEWLCVMYSTWRWKDLDIFSLWDLKQREPGSGAGEHARSCVTIHRYSDFRFCFTNKACLKVTVQS